MQIIKTIFYWDLLIFVAWLIFQIYVWVGNDCRHTTRHYFTYSTEEAEAKRCIIALYKASDKSSTDTILIERTLIKKPWKYCFYTPMDYSQDYYVNSNLLKKNIKQIEFNKDTLFTSYPLYRNGFSNLPSKLLVRFFNSDTLTYVLDIKFEDNINTVARVPFYEKWDSGPWYNDN